MKNLLWKDKECYQLLITGIVEQWLHERFSSEISSLREEATKFINNLPMDGTSIRSILASKIRSPEASILVLVEKEVNNDKIHGDMSRDGDGHFVPDLTHAGTADYIEHLREKKD